VTRAAFARPFSRSALWRASCGFGARGLAEARRDYAEFDGTLTPPTDTAAQNRAVAEYNRLTQALR
jgi:hypothetical protein